MSVDRDRAQAAAKFLLVAHREGKAFGPLPEEIAPRDVEEAYATQEALQNMLSETIGGVVGYKIAATTRVMQQMLGLGEPLSGGIMSKTVYRSPAILHCADYGRLGVECEIAVELREDILPGGAPYGCEAIERYVGAVMPALEVIDDRQADYSKVATLLLPGIADNAWNAGVVLGPAASDWRRVDLTTVRGTLKINGALSGEGLGRDVMGHPFEALAWLVNHLAKRGKTVERGGLVMTGSIIPTKFLRPDDEVSFHADGFGEVHARVE